MPRKLIRKYMPSERSLKENKYLSWLGSSLHSPHLWHLTRKSVSLGCALGLFCAMLPIPGQMVVAALGAIALRSNVAISIGLVWITNPLTIPPIFYCNYVIGTFLLGQPEAAADFQFSLYWLKHSIVHIWPPLLLGSIVMGSICAGIGYIVASRLWIWHVHRAWRTRQAKKQRSRAKQKKAAEKAASRKANDK